MNTTDSDTLITQHFFRKAFPDPQEKNFHTQTGVHFEEIAEMLAVMEGTDSKSSFVLKVVHDACKALAIGLKEGTIKIAIKDRVEFLDGLCDQIVTAIGAGHMVRMDVAGAFGEVNRSNNSKFDDRGQPIFDQNLKLMKGPNYFKPDLKPFV